MSEKLNRKRRPDIPDHTVFELWSKAGGRCEFRGCNKELWQENLTCRKVINSNIAHIVPWSPNDKNKRCDPARAELLAKDISNLMLLCPEHHNSIIDKCSEEFSEEILKEMKIEHEDRICSATSIIPEMKSKIIKYSANIGKYTIQLNEKELYSSIFPQYYPDGEIIEISLNSSWYDNEEKYWEVEAEHLRKQIQDKLYPYINCDTSKRIKHMSVFGFAPQPLLILLGYLLTDKCPATVFQKNRNNEKDWSWKCSETNLNINIEKPDRINGDVPVLNLSLSGKIKNERITKVLGKNCDIWSINTREPHGNIINTQSQLDEFKKQVRILFEEIKTNYKEGTFLNIFPAMPISASIELGRLILPKSDMPMKIYDQIDTKTGFKYALTINQPDERG